MVHHFWTPPHVYGVVFVDGFPPATPVWLARPEPLQTVFRTCNGQHPSTASFEQSYCLEMTSLPIEDLVLRKVRAAAQAFLREFWFDHPHGIDSDHIFVAEHPMVITVLMSHTFRMMDRPSCDGIISAMSSDQ